LPRLGDALVQRFVAALCVVEDDTAVFDMLVGAARRRVAAQGGAWITLGLHESDAFLPLARRSRSRELYSRLYLVHWPEGREFAERVERDRCPYVELGGL